MGTHKLSVLVVEDDSTLRNSYVEILSRWEFDVSAAQDGLAALDMLEHEQPDLLLSDLNMPRMNGYELLSIVRSKYPRVRVVAMSGAHMENEVPDGVVADAFYPKGSGHWARLVTLLKRIGSRRLREKDEAHLMPNSFA